jgi:hypothetical protein
MMIKQRIILIPILLIACLLFFVSTVFAHEIRPAIATATFNKDGSYEIKVVANFEILLAGIGPVHKDTNASPEAKNYNTLRALPADQLTKKIEEYGPRWMSGVEVIFNGIRVVPNIKQIEVPRVGDLDMPRLSNVFLVGRAPNGASIFQWRYDPAFGTSVLRVKRGENKEIVAFWLKSGKKSEPIPVTGAVAPSTLSTFAQFLSLGFTHIVPLGLDHILFILGLYLLSTRAKTLLVQVTSFTVAHSITLGLGLYGVVSIPPAIVEPLIAASIVFVAVENLITDKLTPWRTYVVFCFGLIHGLGFAGVLHEIGLAKSDFINGLIAFNVGVEFGQLAVILGAFLAVGCWFRNRIWYRARVVRPASVIIALIGVFWMVERIN